MDDAWWQLFSCTQQALLLQTLQQGYMQHDEQAVLSYLSCEHYYARNTNQSLLFAAPLCDHSNYHCEQSYTTTRTEWWQCSILWMIDDGG